MQEDLIHDWHASTEDDRDPCPGPVALDERGIGAPGPCVDRDFLAAQQSSVLLEDEEIETLAHEGRAPLP